MNSSLNHGSAKIYQFPVGGRSALGGHRYGETMPAAELAARGIDEVACGDSWYHEAAIRDSKPLGEH